MHFKPKFYEIVYHNGCFSALKAKKYNNFML